MSVIPTVAELLKLPYGDDIGDSRLSVSDLLALTYSGGSPSMKGFTAGNYRKEMRNHGARIAWYQAIESTAATANQQGKIFIEKHLDSDIRAFFFSNTQNVQGQEFGELKEGESRLSVMPDEIRPQRDDRFINLDAAPKGWREQFGGTATTYNLNHQRVLSIEGVWDGDGKALLQSSYSLDRNRLLFRTAPGQRFTVRYTALPEFEWLDEGVRYGFLGTDGAWLPTYGTIRLLTAGEE